MKLYQQARARLAQGEPAAALRLLEKAVDRAPEFADAWNTMGVFAFQNGDWEQAERRFLRAVTADPEAFDAALNLGAMLLRTGRAIQALEHNARAVEMRPLDAGSNAQLGMNYFQLARFAEAERYLTKARDLDPAHPTQPQLFLAEIHRQRGNRAAAVAELQELIAIRPDAPASATLREKSPGLPPRTERAPLW